MSTRSDCEISRDKPEMQHRPPAPNKGVYMDDCKAERLIRITGICICDDDDCKMFAPDFWESFSKWSIGAVAGVLVSYAVMACVELVYIVYIYESSKG